MLLSQKVLNITLEEAMLAYVEEIITPSISNEHVIAAIPVERQVKLLDKCDNFCKGSYKLGTEIQINPECCLPDQTIAQVRSFLEQELQLNMKELNKQSPNSTLIEPDEGYIEGLKK